MFLPGLELLSPSGLADDETCKGAFITCGWSVAALILFAGLSADGGRAGLPLLNTGVDVVLANFVAGGLLVGV